MKYTIIILTALFLSSCSAKLTPFTQRMYDEFAWTDSELKRIQFYLSENVVLYRDAGREQTKIDNGKIRVKDGRKIEEVVIKKGTPGVMIFSPKENRIAISFDKSDDQFLMFGPNPKVNNRYVILGKSWNKSEGQVTYNGKIYQTSSQNAFASLMVDIKEAKKLKYESSVVGGRKVRS